MCRQFTITISNDQYGRYEANPDDHCTANAIVHRPASEGAKISALAKIAANQNSETNAGATSGNSFAGLESVAILSNRSAKR